MKKIYILIGGFTVILIAAAAYTASRPAHSPVGQSNMSPAPLPITQAKPPSAASPGSYVDYRSGIIEATTGTKILFFHAPWCPQCRKLEQSIKAGTIPNNVTIIKVDYDSHQALRKQYGVTIQTTLARVDDAGALVEKYVAYDKPDLAAVTENLLP